MRLVDYKTGRTVADFAPRERAADAWVNHYSFGMGGRTKRHEQEISEKIVKAGVAFSGFDQHGRLKVDNPSHQRKLMKVVLGPEYVNKDSCRG